MTPTRSMMTDSERRRKVAFLVAFCYAWAAMFGFGGIAVETIVIYPNVFHDVPASLVGAVDFFTVTGPADFFPPMGAATALAGLATCLITLPDRSARRWTFASLGTLIVGEFLFSMLYFWPRNDIMFEEGPAVHSVDVLRQTAIEFETGHWGRMLMSALTATFALLAVFATYRRHRLERVDQVRAESN